MPFDGIVTKAVTEELQTTLVNGRITKIYQPTRTELVLTVRNHRKNFTLLLSVHPTYARFHLTKQSFLYPQEPPMFCRVLRKHLSGGFIESIEQSGLERLVTMKIKSINEIGDLSYKYLIIELMGRHSNVLLLNENKEHIIDALKHVSASQNRYRTILPGQLYVPPPSQNKLNPMTIDGETLVRKLDFNAGKLDRQIVNLLTGVSPFYAREMVHQAKLGSRETYQRVFHHFQEFLLRKDYVPAIYVNDREEFHVLPITHLKGEQNTYPSPSEMLDGYYAGKAERDQVKQQSRDLSKFIHNEIAKNKRKLKIHEKTLKKSAKADQYQRQGELLTAHLHLVKQGDSSVTVVDYYDPNQKEITIPLKQDETPSENAQRLFTRYRKLTAAKEKVQLEIKKTKEEITYLTQLLHQLEHARAIDLEDIREELREEGYLKKQRKRKNKKRTKPMPEAYESSDGIPIYVGRNNKQNDYLTNRIAHRNDVWLHTKDIPGSHVVLKSNEPSEIALQEAAQLAAYFSQARLSSNVPVDYTHVRHVKKPSGAKPGFVTYDHQKTIYVTPDEKTIIALKK